MFESRPIDQAKSSSRRQLRCVVKCQVLARNHIWFDSSVIDNIEVDVKFSTLFDVEDLGDAFIMKNEYTSSSPSFHF